jgi:hypothetical protein
MKVPIKITTTINATIVSNVFFILSPLYLFSKICDPLHTAASVPINQFIPIYLSFWQPLLFAISKPHAKKNRVITNNEIKIILYILMNV